MDANVRGGVPPGDTNRKIERIIMAPPEYVIETLMMTFNLPINDLDYVMLLVPEKDVKTLMVDTKMDRIRLPMFKEMSWTRYGN